MSVGCNPATPTFFSFIFPIYFLYYCSMKKLLLVLLFFPFFLFSQSEIKLDTDLKNYEKYMPTSECGEIIHYNYYSVSFCEDDRISEWAIYYMTPDRIGTSKRTNDFRQDINLNQRDASLEDYNG